MNTFAFPASKRLKSQKAIDRLFIPALAKKEGLTPNSSLCYPLRAVWIKDAVRPDGALDTRVLISVPKKKLKRAVDRVKVRRRVREAWRLKSALEDIPQTDVALIYIADRVLDYTRISHAVDRLLAAVSGH